MFGWCSANIRVHARTWRIHTLTNGLFLANFQCMESTLWILPVGCQHRPAKQRHCPRGHPAANSVSNEILSFYYSPTKLNFYNLCIFHLSISAAFLCNLVARHRSGSASDCSASRRSASGESTMGRMAERYWWYLKYSEFHLYVSSFRLTEFNFFVSHWQVYTVKSSHSELLCSLL